MALAALAWLRHKPVARAPITPDVSVVIRAYNEERDIRRKLEECIEADYPTEHLDVIVASDGSTVRTDEIVREFAPRLRLLRIESRDGKTIAQNAAVREARGDMLLLAASIPLATRGPLFQVVLALQLAVYGSGAVAYALERLRVRLPGAFIPLYFCGLSLAPLLALAWMASGEKKVVWETGG